LSRFVVDASVAVKWLVPEAGTDAALALHASPSLIAPELIVAECANILWKKVGRGGLSISQALLAAETLEHWSLTLYPMGSLVRAATRLAIELGHPAYDCVYLALASREKCPFVTADERLVRKIAGGRVAGLPEVLMLAQAAKLVSP
jgi:predicted nucleic acid-binding protein